MEFLLCVFMFMLTVIGCLYWMLSNSELLRGCGILSLGFLIYGVSGEAENWLCFLISFSMISCCGLKGQHVDNHCLEIRRMTKVSLVYTYDAGLSLIHRDPLSFGPRSLAYIFKKDICLKRHIENFQSCVC